MPHIE